LPQDEKKVERMLAKGIATPFPEHAGPVRDPP
jgi:hypothetical protein